MATRLTLADIEALDTEMLTCAQVGPVVGINPYNLHGQALEMPERLGFPVMVVGRQVRIPRRAFVRWMKGSNALDGGETS